MAQPWILLVDCCLGELGRRLGEIIHSSGQFQVQRQEVAIHDDGVGESRTRALRDRVEQLRPREIIVVFGRLSLERDRCFLTSAFLKPPSVPVLVAADTGQPAEILSLLSCGVSDFLVPPLTDLDVLSRVGRFLTEERGAPRPPDELHTKNNGFPRIVGKSPAFLEVMETISAVARCDATVLISGETGTGKELCARTIHYESSRAGKPFVSVNCGALPVELVENELFGHRSGAFTGASSSGDGLIKEAEKGTLFLDEIDCLAPHCQAKLLRFLQEKEYRPLGSPQVRKADIRVLAATNTDPLVAVERGQLRADLYYRLNTVHISLPPLRARREDIPLLAWHFLDKFAREFERDPMRFTQDASLAMLWHDWPGNVREMEHVVERAVILTRGNVLNASSLGLPGRVPFQEADSFQEAKTKVVHSFERNYIEGLLLTHQGNITQAAAAAGKHRRAFWELMRKHQIDAERFRHPG